VKISRRGDGAIEFACFSDGGAVHVLRDELHTIDHTLGNKEVSVVGWLMGRQWALCGRRSPGPGIQYGISEFEDERLCRRCIDVAGGLLESTDELFEHDLPSG
jgi:hypothetical protein